MDDILKRLGIYKALNASAVQFNSIVFRVVVGFLAGVPSEIIALIPAIEFILNFILEIPTGKLADRYGRVPLAILGHVTVILGLSCGYIALLDITSPETSYSLFILHGFFIGFTRPLTSGSVEAFYQDALKRNAANKHDDDVIKKSFTLSKAYGKHLTTIAVVFAFISIYLLNQSIGPHHAFLIGIFLWALALTKLSRDYKYLGDGSKSELHSLSVFSVFKENKRALNSVFYSLTSFMLVGIVMGYFIVALGRDISEQKPSFYWAAIVAFMVGSQGLGWIAKSYILPSLIQKYTEKKYLTLFYLLLLITGISLKYGFHLIPAPYSPMVILFFGMVFFTSFSAIQSVSQNMLLSEVNKSNYAMSLSIQNMPGLLFIGCYSIYLATYKNGCPEVGEIFSSIAYIAAASLALHLNIFAEDTKREI